MAQVPLTQVTLTINGRSYRLGCGEGEQDRLKELARHIGKKVDALVAEFGQAGEARLLLMAAILVADELYDARTGLEAAVTERVEALREIAAAIAVPAPTVKAVERAAPAAAAAPPPTAEKADRKPARIEVPGRTGTSA